MIVMEEKLFSIIVPVYKVEKYLSECVDSLLSQTYTNFEVILVDDGSPDNSPKICDEYAEKDQRVKVVHKLNGGLSDARNEGVRTASGKYLLFVDSDDYYGDSSFLQKLSEHISNYGAQLINFPLRTFLAKTGEFYGDENRAINEELLNGFSNKNEQIRYLISTAKLKVSACTYAVERSVFIKNDLFFEKGIFSEDIEWTMRLLPTVNKISFLSVPGVYSRRGRDGSITNSIKKKNIDDLVYIIEKYAKAFISSNTEIEKLLLNYIAYQYTIVLGLLYRLKDKKIEKQTIKKLKEFKFLFKYDLNPKVKKARKFCKLLGVTLTAKILQFYMKYRGR